MNELKRLKDQCGDLFDLENLDLTYLEKKKWGYKYNIFASPFVSVDICWVEKGGYCSWHYHDYKYNTFFVLSGCLEIKREHTNNDIVQFTIGPSERERRTTVHPQFKHQFKALEDTLFVELETVRCFKEDIYRDNEGGIE